MSKMIFDFEALSDLDEVTFHDTMQAISSYQRVEDGAPCLTLEMIEDRKEYFKRKLKGK